MARVALRARAQALFIELDLLETALGAWRHHELLTGSEHECVGALLDYSPLDLPCAAAASANRRAKNRLFDEVCMLCPPLVPELRATARRYLAARAATRPQHCGGGEHFGERRRVASQRRAAGGGARNRSALLPQSGRACPRSFWAAGVQGDCGLRAIRRWPLASHGAVPRCRRRARSSEVSSLGCSFADSGSVSRGQRTTASPAGDARVSAGLLGCPLTL